MNEILDIIADVFIGSAFGLFFASPIVLIALAHWVCP